MADVFPCFQRDRIVENFAWEGLGFLRFKPGFQKVATFIHSFIYSFNQSIVYSSIHSFIHSFIKSRQPRII